MKKIFSLVELLEENLGNYVDVDEKKILVLSKYLKLRANVDIKTLYRRGFQINIDGKPKWNIQNMTDF